MPPRRSGHTLKSAQTVPGNQCSRPLKRVFADPLVLLAFAGVGRLYSKVLGWAEWLGFVDSVLVGIGFPDPSVVCDSINVIFGVTHSNFSC
jgi:hypothetical protein